MKKVFKYKISDLPVGFNEVKIYINQQLSSIATVLIRESCSNGIYLKYLDDFGRYRFFEFNSLWTGNFLVKKIGVRRNFSGININAQDRSLGVSSDRVIVATADQITQDELTVLSKIYTSPRVYLKVGANDTTTDWLLVDISGNGMFNSGKLKHSKVTLTINLPNNYAVTEI